MTVANSQSHSLRASGMRAVERACFILGATLLTLFASARIAGEVGREQALASFAQDLGAPDRSRWSEIRVRGYEESAGLDLGEPVAVLRIPSLNLEVPVYASDSELHLNRGAGLIAGMGLPDKGGNVGIAGHRDGFFRVLKDIKQGDLIEIQTRARVHGYRVTAIDVIDPADLRALADTEDPTVTLVTCFPFYYVGHAPQRFVVRGTYEWTPRKSSEHA